MKQFINTVIILLLALVTTKSFSQSDTEGLFKQGMILQKQGDYAESVSKFNDALKQEPENAYVHYQIGYSLYRLKRNQEAITHLLVAAKTTKASVSVPANSLLGNIYNESGKAIDAIKAFQDAIKTNPAYPQIYYNLGIIYFGNKQYALAEDAAIEAIKRDTANASNQRLYALVTFHQNKRANALLGLCSFILLEPTGARAVEAYGNIQHILQGGTLKETPGKVVSVKSDATTIALNNGITTSVQSAKAKGFTGYKLLEAELKSIFLFTGQISGKKANKDFFDRYFAGYFEKLANSANMPALTYTIAVNTEWKKNNLQQIDALKNWIQLTERPY